MTPRIIPDPLTDKPTLMVWGENIDDNTIEQAQRSARLPHVESYVALMPDAHFGYGATVGSVIATKGAIKTWNSHEAAQLIDEIPDAYKDIDEVMDAQKDLVQITNTLHQILNYKGTR